MTRLFMIPLTALTLFGCLNSGWNWLDADRMSEQTLNSHVGLIEGRCCLQGRRWGCDPSNFGQTGCVQILGPMRCQRRPWVTMECTSAECRRSSSEHKCEVDIELVRHNQCRPTGHTTTVGCPDEKWQCEVEMRPHTRPTNPKSEKLICDDSISTLCGINYSPCD